MKCEKAGIVQTSIYNGYTIAASGTYRPSIHKVQNETAQSLNILLNPQQPGIKSLDFLYPDCLLYIFPFLPSIVFTLKERARRGFLSLRLVMRALQGHIVR